MLIHTASYVFFYVMLVYFFIIIISSNKTNISASLLDAYKALGQNFSEFQVNRPAFLAIYTTRLVILAPRLEILYFHPNHTLKDQFSDDYHYILSIEKCAGSLRAPSICDIDLSVPGA